MNVPRSRGMKHDHLRRMNDSMRPFSLIALAATPVFAVDFVREVRPIFEKHCYECHGANKQKNDFRLDIKSIAMTGGEDHAPNIIAGKARRVPCSDS